MTVADLIRNRGKVQEVLDFVEALKQLRVITTKGDQPLLHARSAKNTAIDLRGITPNQNASEDDDGGGGDVFGPNGAGDGNVALFDQVTGKLIKDSGVPITDLIGGRIAAGNFTHMQRAASAQSITNGSVITAITLDTVVENDYSVWSASAPTRLTFPSSGLWLIYGAITYAQNTTSMRMNFIRKNGTTTIGLQTAQAVNDTLATIVALSTFDHFAAGDYVELCAQQWSGGTLNVTTADFRAVRIDQSAASGGGGGGSADFTTIVCAGGDVVTAGGEVVWRT